MMVSSLSAAAWVGRLAVRYPHRDAIVDGERRVSYMQLGRRVEHLAGALAAKGVRRGDRVSAMVINGLPMVELYLATARLGAVFLPLNWRLAGPELGWIIKDADPKLLFVSESLIGLADASETDVPRIVVSDRPNAGRDEYEALIAQHLPCPDARVAPSDPWIMLYTSGTTGKPKGCLLDQQGQVIAALSVATQWRSTEADRMLIALPLFHVGGTGLLFAHLSVGACIVIAPRVFDGEAARRLASRENCTELAVVPQFYPRIIAGQQTDPVPLDLRVVTMGGGMHEPELVRRVRDLLKAEPILGYGQTEAGSYIAYIHGTEQLLFPKACGRPLPHLEFHVADNEGNVLPQGSVGELRVRGPGVMTGYWNQPEATQAALRDGWLHTGDLATIDEHGLITLMGRSKELIKTGGENVYPKEVEAVLLEHPAIADCAVFGVPHEHWGEAVKALIALHPGHQLDGKAVVDWVRSRIAGYKRPRFVEFVEALPRTDTAKLMTLELKNRPITPDQVVE